MSLSKGAIVERLRAIGRELRSAVGEVSTLAEPVLEAAEAVETLDEFTNAELVEVTLVDGSKHLTPKPVAVLLSKLQAEAFAARTDAQAEKKQAPQAEAKDIPATVAHGLETARAMGGNRIVAVSVGEVKTSTGLLVRTMVDFDRPPLPPKRVAV